MRARRSLAVFIALLLDLLASSSESAWAQGQNRPDLIVDAPALAQEWTVGWRYIPPGDCSLVEGCVLAAGLRKLLTFTVTTANISQTALLLGDPTTSPYFAYSPCHGHYHLLEFSDYRLTTPGGSGSLVTARKQNWCLLDVIPYLNEPWVPATGGFDCDFQGLSPGWADIYPAEIECQWLDVTDVAAGDYDLTATVNAGRNIQETSYQNNSSTVPLTLPDMNGDPDLILDAAALGSTVRIEKKLFKQGDPAIREGCVGDEGYRRRMIFDTTIANVGRYDFFVGNPATSSLFTYVPSHVHYHLPEYLQYQLFSAQGAPVTGVFRTETKWPDDGAPYVAAPWVRPSPFYFVDNFGLQRGWRTTASQLSLCQGVDITDVPDGTYRLRATVNGAGLYPESNHGNNTVEVTVQVADPPNAMPHRPDGYFVPGEPLDVAMGPGGILTIQFDTGPNSCPASNYNVYYGYGNPGTYQYAGGICDVGVAGTALIQIPDPPSGALTWFNIVGHEGPVEGGHGFDSTGRERPLSGFPFCGITASVPKRSCPSF